MNKNILTYLFITQLFLFAVPTSAQKIVKQDFEYKKIGGSDNLVIKRYGPENQQPDSALPCAIFYHGGGWKNGGPNQFSKQSTHLARRGMVSILVEYRTRKSHTVPPNVCLEDAKSAIRYIRSNAKELGIDPNRLAIGGGSAGGHLAAAATFCKGFNGLEDDLSVSTRANALLLFNPVIDNSSDGYGYDRVAEYWNAFSPLYNIDAPAPPTLFLLGSEDDLIPVKTGRAFKREIRKHGGRCVLKIYQGAEHGFFNSGVSFDETLQDMDDFLVDLGYLQPPIM